MSNAEYGPPSLAAIRTEREEPTWAKLMMLFIPFDDLAKDRTLNMDPKLAHISVEHEPAIAERAVPATETPLPNLAKERTDKELPMVKKSNTEHADPNLPARRTDSVDPICNADTTDIWCNDPTFTVAWTDSDEPSRVYPRTERVEPNAMKSNTEAPNCPTARTEERTDKLDPRPTQESTETELVIRETPVIEQELPNLVACRIDNALPKWTNSRIEIRDPKDFGPRRLRQELEETKFIILKEPPRCVPIAENEDPNRPKLRTLNEDPRLSMSSTEADPLNRQ